MGPKKMLELVLLLVLPPATLSEHSLTYYMTTSSGLQTFPPFMAVAVVDEAAVGYCDSDNTTAVTKQDWAEVFSKSYPQHLQSYSQACNASVPISKALIEDLNKHFKQTEGVHVLQEMYGCKLDDDNNFSAHQQFAYDGEDFIWFDVETLTWVYTELAAAYKTKWEMAFAYNEHKTNFLTKVCPLLLGQYVVYGLSSLQRKVRPSLSLLQKSPSSPVSCHATGFYPDRATMFWRKDGQELHEDVDHGEILPNHDGTFQMRVDLNMSSVKPEDWRRYDCVFNLSGVENNIITKLDKAVIRTNSVLPPPEEPGNMSIPVVLTAVVLVLILMVTLGFIIHKRNAPDSSSGLFEKLSGETSLT